MIHHLKKHTKRLVLLTLVGLVLSLLGLFSLATSRAYTAHAIIPTSLAQQADAKPQLNSSLAIKVLTLNAAHGRRLSYNQLFLNREEIADNLILIANEIKQHQPDIVAIQEIDGPSFWSGGFNQVEALSQSSGYPFYRRGEHGKLNLGMFTASSGTALLSSHKLQNPKSYAFEQTWRDNKGYVLSTIVSPIDQKKTIDIVSLHTDFLNPWIRNKQLEILKKDLQSRGNSVIIMGDFNCDFESAVSCINEFSASLKLKAYKVNSTGLETFPADAPKKRLDWILISQDLEFRTYGRLKAITSDHLGLIAEISHD